MFGILFKSYLPQTHRSARGVWCSSSWSRRTRFCPARCSGSWWCSSPEGSDYNLHGNIIEDIHHHIHFNQKYVCTFPHNAKKKLIKGPLLYLFSTVYYYRSQIYPEPVSDWLKHQTDHCSIPESPLFQPCFQSADSLCVTLDENKEPLPTPLWGDSGDKVGGLPWLLIG